MPSKAVNLANISSGSILTADAVNERIGIGTTTPSKKLEVVGDSTISGNLSVGGTVSYEDVINIDSVGIITARSGIVVTSGVSTFSGDIIVPNKNNNRGIGDKLNEFVSVKDYGAVGDGVNDDTVGIQSAIDAVTTSGGIVSFPAGVYIISSTLRLKQKTHLIGHGGFFQNQFVNNDYRIGGTTIKLAPSSNCDMVLIRLDDADTSADKRSHCSIRNLHLFGNRSASQAPSANELNSSGSGVVLSGVRYITLENVVISKCAEDGLTIGSYTYPNTSLISSNNVDIRACAFLSNKERGVALFGGDSIMTNCQVGYNGTNGISVSGFGLVANNLVWDNMGHGAYVSSTEPTTLTGNKIYDNRKVGVYLASPTTYATITGNTIARNGKGSSSSGFAERSGVLVATGATEQVVITGNSIDGKDPTDPSSPHTEFGIYFTNSATRVRGFAGNSITNTTTPITLADPNNISLHEQSLTGSPHVGFTATSDIDLNDNLLVGINSVGIGTTSPQHGKLHVSNPTPSDTGGLFVHNVLYGNNQDKPYLIVGAPGWTGATTNWNTFGFQHRIKSNSSGTGRITIDTTSGEVFNVLQDGKVGINTDNPQAKLQVAGSSMFGPEGTGQYQGIQLLNGRDSSANVATGFIDFRNNLNTPDAHMFVDHQTNGGSTMIFGTTPAGDRTSDRRAERLRITDSGNIGINESNPLAKLHIDGSGEAPCLILPDSTNSRFSTGLGNINVSGVGQRLDFYAGDSGSNTANLTSAARRMSLTAQGRLGIGSDAPEAPLTITSSQTYNDGGEAVGIKLFHTESAHTPGSNGNPTRVIELTGANTGSSTEIGVIRWKNGDAGVAYTAFSIASFNDNGNKSGNLVFHSCHNGDDTGILTMGSSGKIDLAINAHIRGGLYFKADGNTGTVNVNTNSSTLISWMANTIYSNGQSWSRTATTVNVPATGYYMVTFNGRLTSTAARTNVIFRFNVNGSDLTNDISLNNYVRFDSGHTESSVNLTAFLLLNSGDDIGVSGQQEAAAGTVNLNKEQASLSLVLVG